VVGLGSVERVSDPFAHGRWMVRNRHDGTYFGGHCDEEWSKTGILIAGSWRNAWSTDSHVDAHELAGELGDEWVAVDQRD
jgi:hypothetical protein